MKLGVRAAAIVGLLALVLAGCAPVTVEAEPKTTRTAPPASSECADGEIFSEPFGRCVPGSGTNASDEGQITQSSTAFNSSANEGGTLDYAATSAYLEATIAHLDTVWTNWFVGEGYPEPWVGYILIQQGEAYTSSCVLNGVNTYTFDYPNAMYCHGDMNQSDNGMMVMPIGTMANMWTGTIFTRQVSDLQFVGDFAAGMITAHEFGHHITYELSEVTGKPLPPNPQIEFVADCFAGIWTYALNLDAQLEQGDIEEAFHALAVIGGEEGSSHGTGEQRMNAFAIGIYGTEADPRGGVPQNCIAAYWP